LSDSRLLVIGFGNPLRRDDGVGVAALHELHRRGVEAPGVDLIDGGVRGLNLLSLFEEYEGALVLDAVLANGEPVGEVVEAGLDEARFLLRPRATLHNLDLGTTFELARALGIRLPQVEFVLMKVTDVGYGEGLSDAVEGALPSMVEIVARKIEEFVRRAPGSEAAEVRDGGSQPR